MNSVVETLNLKNYSLAIYNYRNDKVVDLYSPNISINGEVYETRYKREINGYKELTFSIPLYIQNEHGELIENFRVSHLKNESKIVLRKYKDTYTDIYPSEELTPSNFLIPRDSSDNIITEEFVVKDIRESRTNKAVMEVTCQHIVMHRLTRSGWSLYIDSIGTAEELLEEALHLSDWNIGHVDIFWQDEQRTEIKVRTLKVERSNIYNIVQDICDLFNCYALFDYKNKTISLKEEIGRDKGVQFRYRKNLKEVHRDKTTNDIVTKLWVEGGDNPETGLTLISDVNPTGEPYILNFDYYKQIGELTQQQEQQIIDFNINISNINTEIKLLLEQVSIKYLDKINKESEYEGNIYIKAAKNQTLTETIKALETEKNTARRQALITLRDELQSEISIINTEMGILESEISVLDGEIEQLELNLADFYNQKNEVLYDFQIELADFIHEGLWHDSNYIDPEKLYEDAKDISKDYAFPKVSYRMSIPDLSKLSEYNLEDFELGDIVTVIDELLKININGRIAEIEENLDRPQDTIVKIANFKSDFDEMYVKIITSSNIVASKKQIYDRVVTGLNPDGTLDYNLLQKTFDQNKIRIASGTNNSVIDDERGITIIDLDNPMYRTRINAGGIFITENYNEEHPELSDWKVGLNAKGISALNVTSGQIDTRLLKIWNSLKPKFVIDEEGATAYGDNDNIWVRMSENGLQATINDGETFTFNLSSDGSLTLTGTVSLPNAGMTNVGTATTSTRIWAGDSYANRGSAPFRVRHDGRMIASNIDVTGGTITGATVRTSSENDRIELSSNLLRSFAGGVRRVQLDFDSLDFYNSSNVMGGTLLADFSSSWGMPMLSLRADLGVVNLRSRRAFNQYATVDVFSEAINRPAGIVMEVRDGTTSAVSFIDMGPGTMFLGRNVGIDGNFEVYGSKSAVVETENYGNRKMYALETPDNRFVAYMEKELPEGENFIEIEPMFLETITDYFVVPHVQNASDVIILEREKSKFRVWVQGHKAEVVFEINGKRKGFEDIYMEEAIKRN